MRSLRHIAFTAALLAGISASASEVAGSKDKANAAASRQGPQGSMPSVGALGGAEAPVQEGAGTVPAASNASAAGETKASARKWEVGASYEFHTLVRHGDLEGYAPNKYVNYVSAYGSWALTEKDKLSVRLGASQRFLADQTETGIRASDAVFTYSRSFELPQKISLHASASLTAPLSFGSWKMSLITAPSISARAEKTFGDVAVGLRAFDYWYVVRYASAEGGNPNPKTSLGGVADATWTAPFHKAFSVGVDLYTEYFWMYQVTDANDPNITRFGVVLDSQFPTQPVLQAYGGEVFARYELPSWHGINADGLLAFAQGDPTLGYTSVLHDGVAHLYPFWRLTSEVYVAVSGRY